MHFLTQDASGMPMWAALLLSFGFPALLGVPLFAPKRWFVADNDDERRELQRWGKYDPALHGEMGSDTVS